MHTAPGVYRPIWICGILLLGLSLFSAGCSPEDGADKIGSGQVESTGRAGRLSFHYLCEPLGVINTVLCNSTEGNGLLPLVKMFESDERPPECLFFVTGNLMSLEKRTYIDRLYHDKEVELLVPICAALDITAILPGLKDLVPGVGRYKDLFGNLGVPLVCSNLVHEHDQKPVFSPFIVLEIEGVRIGVTGLITNKIVKAHSKDDSIPEGAMMKMDVGEVPAIDSFEEKGYDILEPLKAAESVLSELQGQGTDFNVVLSGLGMKINKKILENTTADFVIGNDSCRKNESISSGGNVCAYTENLASMIGKMDFHFQGDPSAPYGDRSRLESLHADKDREDAKIKSYIEQYQAKDLADLEEKAKGTLNHKRIKKCSANIDEIVKEIERLTGECKTNYFINRYLPIRGFVGAESGGAGRIWNTYLDELSTVMSGREESIKENLIRNGASLLSMVDPQACGECHTEQLSFWEKTAHASAFESVLEMSCDYHPECFRCHSSGFGCENGFYVLPPPDVFQSVNCEACHGALNDHVENFMRPLTFTNISNQHHLAKLCRACHDKKHAPDFDMKEDLFRVACPKIDYKSFALREQLMRRDAELEGIKAEKGFLKPVELYLDQVRIKEILGADTVERAALLQQGLDVDPYNESILFSLNLMLLKEARYAEALANLERYVSKNQTDIRANLEIMRLLILVPDEEARNPALGKKYCQWFLANIGRRNNEVVLLLTQAHILLGEVDEAWAILSNTDTRDLPKAQKEWIEKMVNEVQELRKRKQ